jgi:hypothetical protein
VSPGTIHLQCNTQHAVTMRELVRAVSASIFNSMEDGHRRRCKSRGEQFVSRSHLWPMVIAICWWRAHAARLVDVNHLILIPNRVVESLAFQAPQSGQAVLRVMNDWVKFHRLKHAVRLAGGASESTRTPIADPIDKWEPGPLLWLTSWHLARLLRRVAAGSLPAEVRY